MVLEFYIPEKDRDTIVKRLTKQFNIKHSKKIEKGLYDYSKQYCKNNYAMTSLASAVYMDKANNLIYNCEQNNSTIKKLKKEINQDYFNPYNLAFLRPEELNEDNWKKILQRMDNIENTIKNAAFYEWKPCENCGGTKYTHYQLQTRSADEAMTTFYVCHGCGKNNSINN